MKTPPPPSPVPVRLSIDLRPDFSRANTIYMVVSEGDRNVLTAQIESEADYMHAANFLVSLVGRALSRSRGRP